MIYTENDCILGSIFFIVNTAALALSFILTQFLKGKIIDAVKNVDLKKRFNFYRIHLIIIITFYAMFKFISLVFMYKIERIEFMIIPLMLFLLIFKIFLSIMKLEIALVISNSELTKELI